MLPRIVAKIRRSLGLPEIERYKMRRFLKAHKSLPPINKNQTEKLSLTLIVTCFKHEAYLDKCFESILNQTRKPDEIIFMNNRSPDNTREKINGFIQKYGKTINLKLINNERNLGQAGSLNAGINISKSKYIMILNDDDYLFPEAVETMLEQFKKNPELAMIGANTISFTKDSEITKVLNTSRSNASEKLTIHTPDQVRNYKNYDDISMTHSGSVFVKSVWAQVGGFYSNRLKRMVPFSDRDFQLRVGLLYPIGVLIERPLSFWRSDSSVDSGINS